MQVQSLPPPQKKARSSSYYVKQYIPRKYGDFSNQFEIINSFPGMQDFLRSLEIPHLV